MFRYRLYTPDGDELGEATDAVLIKPGEEIIGEGSQWFRVVDVVPVEEDDESPFVGLLQVEAPEHDGLDKPNAPSYARTLRRVWSYDRDG